MPAQTAPIDTQRHNDPVLVWAPRRQLTLAQARQRSLRVQRLRNGFIAAAAISLGLFLGYIVRSAITTDRRPQIDSTEAAMKNPRFTGRDTAGKAFTITADSAMRQALKAGVVSLAAPILRDEAGGELRAPEGLYDRDAGILELYGDVRLTDPSGYSFMTRGARVFVNENRVEGLSPLMGKGPLGDVRADSYEILDGGKRVIFGGNVNMVIIPESDAPAPAQGGAASESESGDANVRP